METSPDKKEKKWSIGTYLRIKPLKDDVAEQVNYNIQEHVLEDGTKRSAVEIEIPLDADPGLVHNNSASGNFRFEYDHIFPPQITQDEVFQIVAKEKVLDALDGINCTIFAYGQTGSGKTFSIFGGESYKDRGIIPRSISMLFQEVQRRKQANPSFVFRCQVTFTEIYKETVYDLLNTEKRGTSSLNAPGASTGLESFPTVSLYEAEDGIVLKNLNVFEVETEDNALQLFFLGNANRITASTTMNQASSRSHAVFTIVVQSEVMQDNRLVYTTGKMNFVDLAGSERMYKMANSKDAIVEAKAINLSLHFLEQVIVTLREQHHNSPTNNTNPTAGTATGPNSTTSNTTVQYIPYRNSVLTNLLRDSLGGNCRSSFLLTISPEKLHFEESVATCRFGQRCGEVKLSVRANTEIGLSDQLKELQGKVKLLERKVSGLEEKKSALEGMLAQEQEQRVFQTMMREIMEDEKVWCKHCVQELLLAAKESLAVAMTGAAQASYNNNNSNAAPVTPGPSNGILPPNTSFQSLGTPRASLSVSLPAMAFTEQTKKSVREAAEQALLSSQDLLYCAVEQMDKAVLVELVTALGGLIQSMYIDRELMKAEEAHSKKLRQLAEEEKERGRQEEAQAWELLRLGNQAQMRQTWGRLPPPNILQALQAGSFFIKHSRHGLKTLRRLLVSEDGASLVWQTMLPHTPPVPYAPHAYPPSSPGNEAVAIPFAQYEDVSCGMRPTSTIGGSSPLISPGLSPIHLITLKGREGLTKTMILEFIDVPCNGTQYAKLQAQEWIEALRFLIVCHSPPPE